MGTSEPLAWEPSTFMRLFFSPPTQQNKRPSRHLLSIKYISSCPFLYLNLVERVHMQIGWHSSVRVEQVWQLFSLGFMQKMTINFSWGYNSSLLYSSSIGSGGLFWKSLRRSKHQTWRLQSSTRTCVTRAERTKRHLQVLYVGLNVKQIRTSVAKVLRSKNCAQVGARLLSQQLAQFLRAARDLFGAKRLVKLEAKKNKRKVAGNGHRRQTYLSKKKEKRGKKRKSVMERSALFGLTLCAHWMNSCQEQE